MDLWTEFQTARADHQTDPALLKCGVLDAEARWHCGVARIEPAGRFFEPHPNGRAAIVVPVLDGGELCDLLAFDPRQPTRWWLRRGDCPFLGGDNIFCWSAPICVWRTPLRYLQAGLEGVVVLDWRGALPILGTLREIVVEDANQGVEVCSRLSAPLELPMISVLARVAA